EDSGNVAGTHRRLKVVPSLTPDQERRRPGTILPAHDQVRVEELEVEVPGSRSGERLIAITVCARPRRRGQLAQVGPASLTDERGRVYLNRKRRSGGVVHPERQRRRLLIEVREPVMGAGHVRRRAQVL